MRRRARRQPTWRRSPSCCARRGKPKKRAANPALVAGGLKILGYLEDPAALPRCSAFARDKRQPLPVREEAIVALRFTARGKAGARVAAP